jgi:terminase small subunit-like protein
MPALLNPKHEQFAQYVALGEPKTRAYALTYGSKSARQNASRLWLHLSDSPKIRARVNELMAKRRKASELTYDKLLDDTLLTIDLARESGQYAASLTGLRMIGSEMFNAFKEKKEIVNLDIKVNSKAELKAMLIEDYGPDLAEQIWQSWGSSPKLIEGNAEPIEPCSEAQEPK